MNIVQKQIRGREVEMGEHTRRRQVRDGRSQARCTTERMKRRTCLERMHVARREQSADQTMSRMTIMAMMTSTALLEAC